MRVFWGALTMLCVLVLALPSGASASSFDPRSPKKVIVILAKFSDTAAEPYTTADAKAHIFTNADSSSEYLRAASHGNTWLVGNDDPDGDVVGWVTLPYTRSECGSLASWASSAYSLAESTYGLDLDLYDIRVIAYASNTCKSGGFTVNSCSTTCIRGVRIYTPNQVGGPFRSTVSHEIGHAYGLAHANAYNCVGEDGVTRVAFSGSCTSTEYGDVYDAMGGRYHHFSTSRAEYRGWLEPGNVDEGPAGDTFTITPAGLDNTEVQLAKVQRGTATPSWFALEYRDGTAPLDNYTAGESPTNGVIVRYMPTTGNGTYLLDMHPDTTSRFDSDLRLGEVFVDPVTGIWIKLVALDASGATLDTGTGTPPDPGVAGPPTTPTPGENAWIFDGDGVDSDRWSPSDGDLTASWSPPADWDLPQPFDHFEFCVSRAPSCADAEDAERDWTNANDWEAVEDPETYSRGVIRYACVRVVMTDASITDGVCSDGAIWTDLPVGALAYLASTGARRSCGATYATQCAYPRAHRVPVSGRATTPASSPAYADAVIATIRFQRRTSTGAWVTRYTRAVRLSGSWTANATLPAAAATAGRWRTNVSYPATDYTEAHASPWRYALLT